MTDPFRIRAHVPDFEAISADYVRMSEAARARHRHSLDVHYGPGLDERLDLFFPAEMTGPAPVHIFIHGGYWRANRKEDYAFIAEPVLAAGGIAVIVEYSLMPGARMETLVAQVRRAADWVQTHVAEFGGDAGKITASGHSAGAHLAFYLAARGAAESAFPHTGVRGLTLVSGIYDLAPIAQSFLQAEIGLTEDEIAAWSPLGATMAANVDVLLMVGDAETPPFIEQAEALRAKLGVAVELVAGHDHMTIVRKMGLVGGLIG